MPTPKIEPIILQAAIELFGTHGPYGVTFQDLARKAPYTAADQQDIFGIGMFQKREVHRLFRGLLIRYRVQMQPVFDKRDRLSPFYDRDIPVD